MARDGRRLTCGPLPFGNIATPFLPIGSAFALLLEALLLLAEVLLVLNENHDGRVRWLWEVKGS